MKLYRHNEIYLLLKKGASCKDQKLFTEYSKGLIDVKQCLDGFIKNNNIKDAMIMEYDFTLWLSSIGYRR